MILPVCETWSSTGYLWENADWIWSQCPQGNDCAVWGSTGTLWKNANWLWSQCTGSVPPTPSAEVPIPGIDANVLIQPWIIEPWNPYRAADKEWEEKRKKRIQLTLKVKGQEYNVEKYRNDSRVSVGDIKMMVNPVAIDLQVKEENVI